MANHVSHLSDRLTYAWNHPELDLVKGRNVTKVSALLGSSFFSLGFSVLQNWMVIKKKKINEGDSKKGYLIDGFIWTFQDYIFLLFHYSSSLFLISEIAELETEVDFTKLKWISQNFQQDKSKSDAIKSFFIITTRETYNSFIFFLVLLLAVI